MSNEEKRLPVLQRVLAALERAGAQGLTTGELATQFGVQSKVVSNATWYQRKAERLTTDDESGKHTITDLGRRYLEGVLAGVLKRSRKLPYKRPRSATSTAVAATQPTAAQRAVSDRATQAGRHADDLIANARAAIDVHEALLDESVELTPLVRSTIDGIRRSITLIESAYQVARA